METVTLPRIGTAQAWRDAARGLLARQVPPDAVLWRFDADPQADLFGGMQSRPARTATLTVPKSFLDLANRVAWHSDPERFARLYTLLHRLRRDPALMNDRADPDLARLRMMEKAVNRCAHKMKAFVRFRDIGGRGDRRAFAAWFEPTHHTVEPTAPFFTRRFADMDWLIATPDVTARFENGALSFEAGQPKPDLPDDATEELWGTYFRNIFNPARLKVSAMTSEMPRKYWKNLPEARHIPDLIATADARARQMQAAAPTLPPLRATRVNRAHRPRVDHPMTYKELQARAAEESRDLPEDTGRIVLGEGPTDARLMVVGERPGDEEDHQGRPFVGPSGQLFDRVAQDAGLDRAAAYVTNAVKQFRFRQRGKRRLHQPPNRTEIEHGRWWLDMEIRVVQPELILAMGATALQSLTGSREGLLKRRGRVEETGHGPVFVTVHPSYLLRIPDATRREDETARFREDLTAAGRMLA